MVGRVPEQLTTNYPSKTSGPIPDELKQITDKFKEKIELFKDCASDYVITEAEAEKLGLSEEDADRVNNLLARLKTQRETLEQAQQKQNAEQPTDSIGFKVDPERLRMAEGITNKLLESLELPEGKQAIPEETEE